MAGLALDGLWFTLFELSGAPSSPAIFEPDVGKASQHGAVGQASILRSDLVRSENGGCRPTHVGPVDHGDWRLSAKPFI